MITGSGKINREHTIQQAAIIIFNLVLLMCGLCQLTELSKTVANSKICCHICNSLSNSAECIVMAVKLKALLFVLSHFYWAKLSSCQGSMCTVGSQKHFSTTRNLESVCILNLTLCDLHGDNELRVTISTLTGFSAHDTEDRQIMCRDECTSQSITDHTFTLPPLGKTPTTHDDDFLSPTETPPSTTSKLTSECQCTQAGVSDEGTSTTPQTHHQTIFSTTNTKSSPQLTMHSCLQQCDTISGVLGALVGLLLLLLLVVTAGWAWACWTIKKRVRMSNNFSLNSFRNPRYINNTLPTASLDLQSNNYHSQPAHTSQSNEQDTVIANDDAESCEHVYHVLEQSTGDNEYEELDKYAKKKEWSQQTDEDVCYTLEGQAVEEEGPEGGVSTNQTSSEEQSVLIL